MGYEDSFVDRKIKGNPSYLVTTSIQRILAEFCMYLKAKGAIRISEEEHPSKEERMSLEEGMIKKGGRNPSPSTSRPLPPKGQKGKALYARVATLRNTTVKVNNVIAILNAITEEEIVELLDYLNKISPFVDKGSRKKVKALLELKKIKKILE